MPKKHVSFFRSIDAVKFPRRFRKQTPYNFSPIRTGGKTVRFGGSDKPLHVLIYMDGCPACIPEKPVWEKLQSEGRFNIRIINSLDGGEITGMQDTYVGFKQPKGFPAMYRIVGKSAESFDKRGESALRAFMSSPPKRGGQTRRNGARK